MNDTSSDGCIFPRKKLHDKRPRANCDLYAINGTAIHTYGRILLKLYFGPGRKIDWEFTIADVDTPVLGIDFRSHYDLLIDIKHLLIKQTESIPYKDATASPTPTSMVGPITPPSPIIRDFSELTNAHGRPKKPCHNTEHFIRTTPGPPVACRPRRLATDRLEIAKKDFNTMLDEGIARLSDSLWSYALHIVPKKDGFRPCGDYRALSSPTF